MLDMLELSNGRKFCWHLQALTSKERPVHPSLLFPLLFFKTSLEPSGKLSRKALAPGMSQAELWAGSAQAESAEAKCKGGTWSRVCEGWLQQHVA